MTQAAGSSTRWLNIWLCFLLTTVGYIDRTNLAVAAPYIKGDLHIGDAMMGLVLGSFYWSYAGLQLPCGMLVDRVRLRGGIAAAVIVWSVATIGTAWARGAASLFALRLVLGAGEGPIYPAAGRLIATDFGCSERGRASGILQTGSRVGAVLAVPLVSTIIAAYGWRPAFVVTGALGFLLAGIWVALYRDPLPPHARAVPHGAPRSPPGAIWTVLRHRCFLGVATGEFLMLVANYCYLTWFPAYLVRARHFSLGELATLGALPMLACVPAPYLGGLVSDALIARGWPMSAARKTCLTGGALLGACMALVPFVSGDALMIALFCLSAAGLACTCGILFALPAEIAPRPNLAGTVSGLMNCIGNIAGIVTAGFIGALLSATGGSFDMSLFALGAICLLSAACFHFWVGDIVRVEVQALIS